MFLSIFLLASPMLVACSGDDNKNNNNNISVRKPSQENKEKHVTSRILICAGGLMSVSGILFAICAKVAYGGILFAAAACMFFAARSFRMAEDKSKKEGQGAEIAPEQAERRRQE